MKLLFTGFKLFSPLRTHLFIDSRNQYPWLSQGLFHDCCKQKQKKMLEAYKQLKGWDSEEKIIQHEDVLWD